MSLKGWVFVVNPASGSGATGQNWPKTIQRFGEIARELGKTDIEDVEVKFTKAAGDAPILSREAILEGAKVVIAVGGDGSISEVVQGFFDASSGELISQECALGVLPQGTGGDFKRMLPSLSDALDSNLRVLLSGELHAVDVGRGDLQVPGGEGGGEGGAGRRFFVNIASCGSSAVIAQLANETPKFLGGTLSYLTASLRGLATYSPPALRYRCDGGEWTEVKDVNTLAVCNGQYFGGGMRVGPGGNISDGQLFVVVISGCNLFDFVALSPKLYSGEHLEAKQFATSFHCKSIEIENCKGQECTVEIDGETPWQVPATFSVLPGAIKLIY